MGVSIVPVRPRREIKRFSARVVSRQRLMRRMEIENVGGCWTRIAHLAVQSYLEEGGRNVSRHIYARKEESSCARAYIGFRTD